MFGHPLRITRTIFRIHLKLLCYHGVRVFYLISKYSPPRLREGLGEGSVGSGMFSPKARNFDRVLIRLLYSANRKNGHLEILDDLRRPRWFMNIPPKQNQKNSAFLSLRSEV